MIIGRLLTPAQLLRKSRAHVRQSAQCINSRRKMQNVRGDSSDILNLRVGIRRDHWDVAAYVNNVTDERAFLSLDREREPRARISYLTNQPRTFGIATRFDCESF
jgi:outer membrane receptor protein involved in Fe transport